MTVESGDWKRMKDKLAHPESIKNGPRRTPVFVEVQPPTKDEIFAQYCLETTSGKTLENTVRQQNDWNRRLTRAMPQLPERKEMPLIPEKKPIRRKDDKSAGDQIREMAAAHPDWGPAQITKHFPHVHPAYVRAAIYRGRQWAKQGTGDKK